MPGLGDSAGTLWFVGVIAALLVLFIARTHALGLNGLAILVVLVIAWRLLVARPAGLLDDLVATLRWRT